MLKRAWHRVVYVNFSPKLSSKLKQTKMNFIAILWWFIQLSDSIQYELEVTTSRNTKVGDVAWILLEIYDFNYSNTSIAESLKKVNNAFDDANSVYSFDLDVEVDDSSIDFMGEEINETLFDLYIAFATSSSELCINNVKLNKTVIYSGSNLCTIEFVDNDKSNGCKYLLFSSVRDLESSDSFVETEYVFDTEDCSFPISVSFDYDDGTITAIEIVAIIDVAFFGIFALCGICLWFWSSSDTGYSCACCCFDRRDSSELNCLGIGAFCCIFIITVLIIIGPIIAVHGINNNVDQGLLSFSYVLTVMAAIVYGCAVGGICCGSFGEKLDLGKVCITM